MIAYKAGGTRVELTPLTVKPQILDGNPLEASRRLIDAAAGGPVRSGIYEVSRGKFVITFAFHELATVLEGTVELTDVAGNSVTYGPGDSWFCLKGEKVTWNVTSDRLRKCFMAVDPDHVNRDGGMIEPLAYKGPETQGAIPVIG